MIQTDALAVHPSNGSTRRRLRVGVLELLTDKKIDGWLSHAYATYLTKNYISIMPQAVSVWCRQLGHTVFYATYYGQDDPKGLLPDDLDVVIIGTFTRSSALAYALAKLFRGEKTLTVIGGSHAKSFPLDCLRYFDLVVQECDKTLIEDILGGQYSTPSIVTSGRRLSQFPSVEERMPEIKASVFNRGRRTRTTVVPMLSSVGCPYDCNFCQDWDSPFVTVPADQFEADLRYLSEYLPDVMIAYHDPNFAVRFDETMDIIERIPEGRRNRYVMESSLSILKESRMHRLRDTNCLFVAPGVESWSDYSKKAGVGSKQGNAKLQQVIDHFDAIGKFVPGIQANFVFGTDGDKGPEPVELTKEFIRRLPAVWPTLNIVTPLGGTPLFDDYMAEDRVLRSMPFTEYFSLHHLVTTLKHYHPVEFYDHLIDIYKQIGSARMIVRRAMAKLPPFFRMLNTIRSLDDRRDLTELRKVRGMLADDSGFLAFHEGRSDRLPPYYEHLFKKRMGPHAELIPPSERTPMLDQPPRLPPAVDRPRQRPAAEAG